MWVKNLYIFIVRRCSTMAESINHIQWFELSGLEEAREDQEGLTGMSGGWMDGWRKESREGRGRKAVLFYLGRLWVVAPSLKYTRLTPTLSSRLRGRDGATPPAEDIQRENKLSAAQTGSDGRLTREGGEAGGCHSVNTTQSTEAMMCSLWGGEVRLGVSVLGFFSAPSWRGSRLRTSGQRTTMRPNGKCPGKSCVVLKTLSKLPKTTQYSLVFSK